MASPDPAIRPKDYAFADFADGAVLLDLRTGVFFRLNRSAAALCRAMLAGKNAEEVARDHAAAFGLGLPTARRDVEILCSQLKSVPAFRAANPITFAADREGLTLRREGRPTWRVSADGRNLRYLADPPAVGPDARTHLLWVAPHLLRLRGRPVLHASAVAANGAVIAFCGSSGRGKTTLCHQLAAHGMTPVAEDLVVLDLDQKPEVVCDGERFLRSWAEEQATELRTGSAVSTDRLDEVTNGPRLPLGKVLFLHRTEADSIREHPLSRADALVHLLENSFAEIGQADLWRQLWEENCKLVEAVSMATVEIPEGLDCLDAAAAGYAKQILVRGR